MFFKFYLTLTFVDLFRFQTDFMISGIAPFGDYLVALAYIVEEASQVPLYLPLYLLLISTDLPTS